MKIPVKKFDQRKQELIDKKKKTKAINFSPYKAIRELEGEFKDNYKNLLDKQIIPNVIKVVKEASK